MISVAIKWKILFSCKLHYGIRLFISEMRSAHTLRISMLLVMEWTRTLKHLTAGKTKRTCSSLWIFTNSIKKKTTGRKFFFLDEREEFLTGLSINACRFPLQGQHRENPLWPSLNTLSCWARGHVDTWSGPSVLTLEKQDVETPSFLTTPSHLREMLFFFFCLFLLFRDQSNATHYTLVFAASHLAVRSDKN